MGIDDTHMKIRGAPVLDEPALSPHQKMIADKLAVSELMSMAVVALPPICKVRPLILDIFRCQAVGTLACPGLAKALQPFPLKHRHT